MNSCRLNIDLDKLLTAAALTALPVELQTQWEGRPSRVYTMCRQVDYLLAKKDREETFPLIGLSQASDEVREIFSS